MGCTNAKTEELITQHIIEPNSPVVLTINRRGRRGNLFGASYAESITDHYEILKAIGSGAIGTLFYAKHIRSQEFRTLREINKFSLKEEAVSISQEVNILKELDHPNIMKVYEAIETPRSIYIALEYISGLSLKQKVKATGCETMLATIMLEVCSALNYLHLKGIAHCSLCPDYIFQIGNGYDSITKIIGFTGAQRLNDKQDVNLKKIRYEFASPELLKGEFNEKTDI